MCVARWPSRRWRRNRGSSGSIPSEYPTSNGVTVGALSTPSRSCCPRASATRSRGAEPTSGSRRSAETSEPNTLAAWLIVHHLAQADAAGHRSPGNAARDPRRSLRTGGRSLTLTAAAGTSSGGREAAAPYPWGAAVCLRVACAYAKITPPDGVALRRRSAINLYPGGPCCYGCIILRPLRLLSRGGSSLPAASACVLLALGVVVAIALLARGGGSVASSEPGAPEPRAAPATALPIATALPAATDSRVAPVESPEQVAPKLPDAPATGVPTVAALPDALGCAHRRARRNALGGGGAAARGRTRATIPTGLYTDAFDAPEIR